MIKRLLLLTTLGVMMSGCYMVPLAFLGPAINGINTVSLLQTGFSTSANYVVKKSTGKSISEHALGIINDEILQQAYFPLENITIEKDASSKLIYPPQLKKIK